MGRHPRAPGDYFSFDIDCRNLLTQQRWAIRQQEPSPSPSLPCLPASASRSWTGARRKPERGQCAGEPTTARTSSPSMAFPLRKMMMTRGKATLPDSANMAVAIGESPGNPPGWGTDCKTSLRWSWARVDRPERSQCPRGPAVSRGWCCDLGV